MPLRSEEMSSNKDMLSELVEQMDRRLPNRPLRSLCELRLNTKDYAALCRWVKEKLTRSTIRLSRWKAGAIIFNVITEVARREAVGHRLWPIVAEKFSDQVRSYLFPNNHPSQELKSFIQQAARELRLRHVFDDDENQGWYITTHLQFGFARPSFMAKLPEWLCGQGCPDSVKRLLAGHLASNSFCDLWQALRYFRRDWITEDQLRTIIDASPWVLAEWKDDLIRLSREQLHLVDVESGAEDADSEPQAIAGEIRCQWLTGSEPQFTCELEDLKPLGLTAPHYQLQVGDLPSATLFRQPDGTYISDKTQLSLSAHLPQVDLKLIDPAGQLHLSQLLDLWNAAAEINAFELSSGSPTDIADGELSTNKAYALFVSPDLQVVPAPDTWALLTGKVRRKVIMLRPPWDIAALQVTTADGAVLWSPRIRRVEESRHNRTSNGNIWIQLAGRHAAAQVGTTVQPVIRGLPERARLTFARLNGRPVSFDANANLLSAVQITPADAQVGLHFHLGVHLAGELSGQDGHTVHVRCPIDVDVTGAAYLGAEGWNALASRNLISSRECRERSFRVFLPRELRAQKVALMEGPRLLRWIGHRAAPFGHTYGMGAPLVVRSQPYNTATELLSIAKGVEDSGVVESLLLDPGNPTTFSLELARPIALSPDHCLVAWPCGDSREPALIDHTSIQVHDEGRRWTVPSSPHRLNEHAAVALAFQGQWLGGARCGDVIDLFHDLSELNENKHLLASLVRWLRLPVLLSDRRGSPPAFSRFAHSYPDAVISSWLRNQGLPHSLLYDEGFDRRQFETTQLRELYLGWSPTLEQAQAIVSVLGHNPSDPLGDVVLALLADLPLVTGHIMRHWLKTRGTPQNCPVSFYVNLLRVQLVSKHSSGRTTARQMDELLLRAAEAMKAGPQAAADEHFVRHAIVAPAIQSLRGGLLTPLDRSNLAVALQVASFRQYLAMCVLEEVEREFQNQ